MKTLDLFIHGDPEPQPRVKAVARGGFVRMYTPKTADAWKRAVSIAIHNEMMEKFRKHEGFDRKGPFAVGMEFILPRPKSHFGVGQREDIVKPSAPAEAIGKPDIDNLAKAVLDAITKTALIWKDDSQVVICNVRKSLEMGGIVRGYYGLRLIIRQYEISEASTEIW